MKNLITFLIAYFAITALFSQSEYLSERNGAKHLWGPHEYSALLEPPFAEWYKKSQDEYEPNTDVFNDLDILIDSEVTVYIGTWCGDTKRWVPKFMKLWKSLDLPLDRIKLIALHNEPDHYKQGPNGEEKGQNIHKVPTFIFHKEGKEVGRMVERPLTSLEIDLAQIDKGISTQPRYQAVNWLNQYFSDNTNASEYDIEDAYRGVRRNVTASDELNTYGYVLFAANEIEKAQFVFELNTRIFPYDPKAHGNLGQLYKECEEWDKAKETFIKILSINPDDEKAINMLYEINQVLADL